MTEKLAAEIVKKSGIMHDTGMTSATPKPRAGEHAWHDDKMLIFALRDENDALRKALEVMEEGYRERCEYCGGREATCARLETQFGIACRAQQARAARATLAKHGR